MKQGMRMTIFLNFAVLVTIPLMPSALAQDNGYRNFGEAIGRSIAGNQRAMQDAEYRGQLRALELINAQEQMRAAQTEARIAELTKQNQDFLAKMWSATGISTEESRSIASTWRFEESQIAINERAQRDGMQTTVDAAKAAYQRYDYLLANQLLIAASRITELPPESSP